MWCVAEGGWGRWKEAECWWVGCVLMATFSFCHFSQMLVHSSDAPCCFLLPIHFGCQRLCSPPATSAGTDPLPARSCPAVPARAPTHPGHSTCCCRLSYHCSRSQAKVGRVTQQYFCSCACTCNSASPVHLSTNFFLSVALKVIFLFSHVFYDSSVQRQGVLKNNFVCHVSCMPLPYTHVHACSFKCCRCGITGWVWSSTLYDLDSPWTISCVLETWQKACSRIV